MPSCRTGLMHGADARAEVIKQRLEYQHCTEKVLSVTHKSKGVTQNLRNPLILLVPAAGLEPAT
ncbi:hypothetical protein HTY52_18960 [Cupriavidus taiwanensis]|uniref:hypothetical protein n=1 Tax=Cupriavidus taiwanensis TaxID=164546 RepID=UPI0015730ADE|nr:hypothetical protein [Cupriavidus taiwanensis]NSX16169.1 hypothetical protein [Cupriavidus taiwanensis]